MKRPLKKKCKYELKMCPCVLGPSETKLVTLIICSRFAELASSCTWQHYVLLMCKHRKCCWELHMEALCIFVSLLEEDWIKKARHIWKEKCSPRRHLNEFEWAILSCSAICRLLWKCVCKSDKVSSGPGSWGSIGNQSSNHKHYGGNMVRKLDQQRGDLKTWEPLCSCYPNPRTRYPEGIQLIHFPK